MDITNRDRVLATDGSKIASETIPFARMVRGVSGSPGEVELVQSAAPHRATGPALYLQQIASQNEAEEYQEKDPVLIGLEGPLPAEYSNSTGNPVDVEPDMFLVLADDGFVDLEVTPYTKTINSLYKVVVGKLAVADATTAYLEVVKA